MNDIEILYGNLDRKCIMSEDGTTNYHIGLKRRHIVRILPTYKTRNRFCANMMKIGPVTPAITRVINAPFWKRRQKSAYLTKSHQLLDRSSTTFHFC